MDKRLSFQRFFSVRSYRVLNIFKKNDNCDDCKVKITISNDDYDDDDDVQLNVNQSSRNSIRYVAIHYVASDIIFNPLHRVQPINVITTV